MNFIKNDMFFMFGWVTFLVHQLLICSVQAHTRTLLEQQPDAPGGGVASIAYVWT